MNDAQQINNENINEDLVKNGEQYYYNLRDSLLEEELDIQNKKIENK